MIRFSTTLTSPLCFSNSCLCVYDVNDSSWEHRRKRRNEEKRDDDDDEDLYI